MSGFHLNSTFNKLFSHQTFTFTKVQRRNEKKKCQQFEHATVWFNDILQFLHFTSLQSICYSLKFSCFLFGLFVDVGWAPTNSFQFCASDEWSELKWKIIYLFGHHTHITQDLSSVQNTQMGCEESECLEYGQQCLHTRTGNC